MKTTLARLIAPTAFLLLPALALADVLPPDQCDSSKKSGDSCENAGPGGDQSGACVDKKCGRIAYYPDGGRGSAEYACLTCDADAARTSESDSSTSSGGGCSITPWTRDRLTAGGMLALGLVAFGFSRRRRA